MEMESGFLENAYSMFLLVSRLVFQLWVMYMYMEQMEGRETKRGARVGRSLEEEGEGEGCTEELKNPPLYAYGEGEDY